MDAEGAHLPLALVDEMLEVIQHQAHRQKKLVTLIQSMRDLVPFLAADPGAVFLRRRPDGTSEWIQTPTPEDRRQAIEEKLAEWRRTPLRGYRGEVTPTEHRFTQYASAVTLVWCHLVDRLLDPPVTRDAVAVVLPVLQELWSGLQVFPALKTARPFPAAIVDTVMEHLSKHDGVVTREKVLNAAGEFVMALAGDFKESDWESFMQQVRREWRRTPPLPVISGGPGGFSTLLPRDEQQST